MRQSADPQLRELAVEFHNRVITLRRVARRVVRSHMPGLPSSESELLALVSRSPDIGVNDAARALQLSANSVSTLIKSLVARGLLERVTDPADRRAARLRLTAAGTARIRHIKRRRAAVLTSAMEELTEKDRKSLKAALPAMQLLLARLTEADPGKGA